MLYIQHFKTLIKKNDIERKKKLWYLNLINFNEKPVVVFQDNELLTHNGEDSNLG